jgi:dTDP-glucose 4,6-dehydratase
MMRQLKNILVTGGAGFIGSNFIRYVFKKTNFDGRIVNIDKLTYAGNLENLLDIDDEYGGRRYYFEKVDICEYEKLFQISLKYNIDTVVHFAAESHVDRSIFGPGEFIRTNITGTFNLLEVIRKLWKKRERVLFHHISTDEVYGSLDQKGYFYETTPYKPHSPYSASKASSDHLVRSYHDTYGVPFTLSNCSNNYGPYQFPEKLIPLMMLNILDEKPLPVYGDGKNVRDWLFVEDHAAAVWLILNRGIIGETYNIGGNNEWENIKLVNALCEKMALFTKKEKDHYKKLISFVKDRPGHDRRYAINCDKIKRDLQWKPGLNFGEGLDITIKWYLNNKRWISNIQSGDYKKWISSNYDNRDAKS